MSVYINSNILVLHPGTNYKIGDTSKPVDELHHTSLSKLSPVSCAGDALQKLLRVLSCDRRSFNRVMLTYQHDDRRRADVKPQLICPVGINKMREIVHRIYAFQVANVKGQLRGPAADDVRI